MSTVVANTLRSLSPSTSPPAVQRGDGTEVGWFARAWVNFSVSTGTPVIGAAKNVSSVTDNGVGVFTVNFTTAAPNAFYSAVGSCRRNGADSNLDFSLGQNGYQYDTAGLSCITRTSNTFAPEDASIVNMAFFW